MAVLEIGDPFVSVVGELAAQIGPWHQAFVADDAKLDLKGERLIPLGIRRWISIVDDKHRHGLGAGWHQLAVGVAHLAHQRDELETKRVWYRNAGASPRSLAYVHGELCPSRRAPPLLPALGWPLNFAGLFFGQ